MASNKQPSRSSIVRDGHQIVHTTWPEGTEMVEEFDLESDDLLVRKWRHPTTLGGEGVWDYEIGKAPQRQAGSSADTGFAESTNNPFFFRKDTVTHFQWRVRNCPWPLEVYSVVVEHSTQLLVLRTSNRKYYKRFPCPDLQRAGIALDGSNVELNWGSNVLVISYKKPDSIMRREYEEKLERRKLKAEKPPRDGDVECPQQ